MKSKLLTLALCIASTVAYAQIPSGTLFVLGGICFDNSKSVEPEASGPTSFIDLETKSTNFQLKIGGGYAFSENQAVGLKIGLDNNKYVDEDLDFVGPDPDISTYTEKDNRFYIAPFYRYYYFCAPQFAIIGQVRVPIAFIGGETLQENADGTSDKFEHPGAMGVGVWFNPSFAWFPKETWSVEAGIGRLGFYSESYKDDNDNKHSTTDVSAKLWLFQPRIAFTYYFRSDQ